MIDGGTRNIAERDISELREQISILENSKAVSDASHAERAAQFEEEISTLTSQLRVMEQSDAVHKSTISSLEEQLADAKKLTEALARVQEENTTLKAKIDELTTV